MSQYPVEIPYSFSVDLSIRENQIPFVKTSVLTDNLPEESIDFTPNQDVPVYTPTWYVYGDDTLLYVGDSILSNLGKISSSNFWRAKYVYSSRALWSAELYDTIYYYIGEHNANAIAWIATDGKYRIACPDRFSFPPVTGSGILNPPYPNLPYSTITIKRNTGLSTDGVEETIASGSKATIASTVLSDNEADFSSITDNYHYVRIISGTNITQGIYKIIAHTLNTLTLGSNPGDSNTEDVVYSISESYAIAQGVNSNYDIPDYYTFPNLTKRMYRRYPNVQMTTSKVWLKVGINKYRLIVYGRFYKWTNKQVREGEGNYIEGTYNYVPDYHIGIPAPVVWQFWSFYKLDSYTETSKNIKLYEPEYNPSNVRLLVNYVNNSGQNEIRQYTIQA